LFDWLRKRLGRREKKRGISFVFSDDIDDEGAEIVFAEEIGEKLIEQCLILDKERLRKNKGRDYVA
jgi:hypothetical protein